MVPKPHGGVLNDLLLKGEGRESARELAASLSSLALSAELASDVMSMAKGIMSPLEGFMGRQDLKAVLESGRLANGLPWTIPIVLDVSMEEAKGIGQKVALSYQGAPFAILEVQEIYPYDKEAIAKAVFGTTDSRHPGVAKVHNLKERLVGGRVRVFRDLESLYFKYALRPQETRVLFEAKGWRNVVGFQTRNVPHLGHEFVQKTALNFVDGLFINPVIGKKKRGDFKDEVILACYQALFDHYYPKERAVLAILETEMRYAGPREAIFHAILRKNFGCTHFVVGRDHAGVGNFYPPYAAQEIFSDYPDLGITPLLVPDVFYCRRCESIASEKICPHQEGDRLNFSGTALREAIRARQGPEGAAKSLIRPEVAAVIRQFENPFVE